MAKNPGCWANVLDDCEGALTGEHRISVNVWAVPEGKPETRKSREARSITYKLWDQDRGIKAQRKLTVKNLTANVLCKHHNEATSDLDIEAGRFARAIEQSREANKSREWLANVGPPFLRWNLRTYAVDGPLLERWFLKAAINNTFQATEMPIGSPTGTPGWPTRELVEMVYGVRPVPRDEGAGLFLLAAVSQKLDFSEEFSLLYFDRNSTHVAGCVFSFRTMHFGVHFEATRLGHIFEKVEHLRGMTLLQPFRALNTGRTNVEVRLLWTPATDAGST